MTTTQERTSFQRNVISDNLPPDLLDMAVEWIAANLSPEDVFEEDRLSAWAKGNDFIHTSEIEDAS